MTPHPTGPIFSRVVDYGGELVDQASITPGVPADQLDYSEILYGQVPKEFEDREAWLKDVITQARETYKDQLITKLEKFYQDGARYKDVIQFIKDNL